jgi:hypothetical protein
MTSDSTSFSAGYVSITVAPATPVATGDAYSCPFNASCSVGAAAGVLANDASANAGAALAASLAAQPSSGSVALAANGSFVYTPQQ